MKLDITKVDLTNNNQKIVAGVILAGVVGLIYFLLPPFIWFMTHLIYAGVLAGVVTLGVLNRNNIWMSFKQLSWNITKKIISSDKLWHMYRYHDYMLKKIADLDANIKAVGAAEVKMQRKVSELKSSLDNDQSTVIQYEKKKAPQTVIRVLANKINLVQKQLDMYVPQAVSISRQKAGLIEIYDAWVADTEILKITLDMKADEYTTLKELSEASDNASAFLKGNSVEYKMYQESLQQIETSVTEYIANTQNFDRQVKPLLDNISMDRAVSEDAGMKLIEEYKAKRITLENPNQ